MVFMNLIRPKIKESFNKKNVIFSSVFGFLMGLSFVLGYQLERYGMTLPGVLGKAKIISYSFLLMLPIGLVACFLFTFFGNLEYRIKSDVRPLSFFLISFISIVICRIPVFLAYSPAVMSYDFGRQITEAIKGHVWFWDYQPLIHTELIRIFYLIGLRLGSIEIGMALLSVFQILVLSAVMAYSASLVVRITRSPATGIVLSVIYALLPIHGLINVIMTKDVLFGAFFLLFICLIYERTLKKNIWIDIAIILTAVLANMFRKNSVYAMCFLIIGFLFYERSLKEKIKSAALICICVAMSLLCQKAMVEGFDVIRGSNKEMYSVPMMQFMRTYELQKDNLTPEQYEMINRVLPLENEYLHYDPYFADSVKNNLSDRVNLWEGSPAGFSHEWFALFKAYPNDFIDAFLFLNKGYWYLPDRVYAEVLGVGAEGGKGLLHTYNHTYEIEELDGGIEETVYAPHVRRLYEKIINENGFFKWPVLNLLFRPAFYFWILIFSVFLSIYRKNHKGLCLVLYPLFYMATLFLGPLVYLRYMYPLILAVPVLLGISLDNLPPKTSKKEK